MAERNGCLLVKLQHGIVGLPDRLLLRPDGTVAFIEFKRPGEKLTNIQLYRMLQLQRMRFSVFKVSSAASFDRVLTA